MSALLIAALVVAYLYAFWVLYIAVMGAYRAHLSGRLVGVLRWMAWPLVIVGFVVDALCQYTLATLLFLDLPAKGEHLVTDRLQRYMARPGTWRGKTARYI